MHEAFASSFERGDDWTVIVLWVVIGIGVATAGGFGLRRLLVKLGWWPEPVLSAEDQKRLARRVAASPLHVTFRAADSRLTDFQVRPVQFTNADRGGPEVPKDVLDQLEGYVAKLRGRKRRKDLRLEYRDGQWKPRQAKRDRPAEEDEGGGEQPVLS
jgi:hypothetical protein